MQADSFKARDDVNWIDHAVSWSRRLHPYVPGKPVEQLLAERGIAEAVKLASNENPYGPSPKAIKAIRAAAAGVHRYPDGDSRKLKAALAACHRVDPERILLGNGSNEVLELVIRTFAGPGDQVVYSQRGFIVYALAATASGAEGVAVPEADGLSHDLEAMAAAVNPRTKVVCVANPNNPTGTLIETEDLQKFLDGLPRDLVVIVDEAYYEFVAERVGDTLRRLRHPGLVISRTFSKAYGLAGCRVGYAVADAELLAVVNRFREPFNINALAQSAALAALEDHAWVMARVEDIIHQRARLEEYLADHDLLAAPSHGNFVLLRHPRADEFLRRLEDQGIIPRPLGPYGMQEYLRITVGTKQENDRLLTALDQLLRSEA